MKRKIGYSLDGIFCFIQTTFGYRKTVNTYRPSKVEMKRYRRSVRRQRQAILAQYGRDDVAERARRVDVNIGLIMFQARPELGPARRATHSAAAQSRGLAAKLVAERFYPQFEHAVTGHLKTHKRKKTVNHCRNAQANTIVYKLVRQAISKRLTAFEHRFLESMLNNGSQKTRFWTLFTLDSATVFVSSSNIPCWQLRKKSTATPSRIG